MRLLQDRAQSNGKNSIDINHFDFEQSPEWNDQTDLDRYIKNKDINKELTKKIVYKANKLVPLSSIIFKYNINWIVSQNQSGWTHKSCCPFPDHKDSTPSFGYNSKDERFHCFGCHRTGNTVQFLSFMESRPAFEIAKEIIFRFKSPDDLIIDLDDSQYDKTDDLLNEFSKEVRLFLQKNSENPKSLQYVESITWVLDVYLEKHTISGTINFETLHAIIEKLREYLILFG